MSRIRKFIVALVGVIISLLLLHYGQSNQVVNAVVLLATAAGVYIAPNSPGSTL